LCIGHRFSFSKKWHVNRILRNDVLNEDRARIFCEDLFQESVSLMQVSVVCAIVCTIKIAHPKKYRPAILD
jgi:hypothetical protein